MLNFSILLSHMYCRNIAAFLSSLLTVIFFMISAAGSIAQARYNSTGLVADESPDDSAPTLVWLDFFNTPGRILSNLRFDESSKDEFTQPGRRGVTAKFAGFPLHIRDGRGVLDGKHVDQRPSIVLTSCR